MGRDVKTDKILQLWWKIKNGIKLSNNENMFQKCYIFDKLKMFS